MQGEGRHMIHLMHAVALIGLLIGFVPALASAQPARPLDRDAWIALAKSGFRLPEGQRPIDWLVEMNALVASPDPVLRDDVAYSAAERWILRDKVVSPDERRTLIRQWTTAV
jgi:hypothetical protein